MPENRSVGIGRDRYSEENEMGKDLNTVRYDYDNSFFHYYYYSSNRFHLVKSNKDVNIHKEHSTKNHGLTNGWIIEQAMFRGHNKQRKGKWKKLIIIEDRKSRNLHKEIFICHLLHDRWADRLGKLYTGCFGKGYLHKNNNQQFNLNNS